VPGYTRRELKHDRFVDAKKDTLSWAVEHQNTLITAGVIILLAALAVSGGWYYLNRQNEKASVAIGAAVRTFQRPIRPAGSPPIPDQPSFASLKERGAAAEKEFLAVADSYPHTKSADLAGYMAGVAAAEAGDNAVAEKQLKDAAASRQEDLASLAKMALASLYQVQKRDSDALALYNQVADHPTATVPKASALFAKAELLERTNPGEATKVYQQIKAEDPSGQIGQLADERMKSGTAPPAAPQTRPQN
jgi:predicted negative regulator of RcsB-dependent stress response